MKLTLGERIWLTFGWNRMIARLVAAWFSFVALLLMRADGYLYVEFMQEKVTLVQAGVAVLGFFLLYSVVAVIAGRWSSDSWFLLIAATVSVMRWLNEYSGYMGGELVAMAAILVYALVLVWTVNKNRRLIRLWQPRQSTVIVLTSVAAIVACVILAVIGCLRYKTFVAPNFDFGIFCNMFYNMAKTGDPMVTCERNGLLSHFAVHLSPIFYLLLPFYWLFPSPLTLQIGQAVILMLGVIPVYLLCRHYRLSSRVTLLVSCLYVFYPAISTGCFYDIHENCFLPFFLLWTFYFLEKKYYLPMSLSALCVLMVKEDAAVYLLVFAVYLLVSRKDRWTGLFLGIASLTYFYFAVEYLEKNGLGIMSNRFDNLIPNAEDGLMGAVKTAILNPGYLVTQLFNTSDWSSWDKIQFVLMIFLPMGLIPFCTKKASRWLLTTPILINLLTMYPYMHQVGFQYQFGVCAFLIYATIQNIPDMKAPTKRTLLSIAAASCLCLYLFSVFPTMTMYMHSWRDNREQYARMEEILDTIPENASVNASTFLVPYLADRDVIYEIDYHGNETDIEYVVVDLRFGSEKSTISYYNSQGYETYAFEEDLLLILKFNPDYVFD